ncbi:DCTN3 protein, partial [Atractosteus spatula]|nr:DCTN3 protein [Atractosteus spatula]
MEGGNDVRDLEKRLQELEKRVYGDRGNRGNKPVKCADVLGKIQASLVNTSNKRERVKILHKKSECAEYRPDEFGEPLVKYLPMKEEFLRSQAALLEQVSSLQPLLDSAHIKAVPDHATKLQRLAQIHIKQQDQCETLSEEVKKQFEDYNKMMFLLSKQFSQWDEMLRQLENASQVKPVVE